MGQMLQIHSWCYRMAGRSVFTLQDLSRSNHGCFVAICTIPMLILGPELEADSTTNRSSRGKHCNNSVWSKDNIKAGIYSVCKARISLVETGRNWMVGCSGGLSISCTDIRGWGHWEDACGVTSFSLIFFHARTNSKFQYPFHVSKPKYCNMILFETVVLLVVDLL